MVTQIERRKMIRGGLPPLHILKLSITIKADQGWSNLQRYWGWVVPIDIDSQQTPELLTPFIPNMGKHPQGWISVPIKPPRQTVHRNREKIAMPRRSSHDDMFSLPKLHVGLTTYREIHWPINQFLILFQRLYIPFISVTDFVVKGWEMNSRMSHYEREEEKDHWSITLSTIGIDILLWEPYPPSRYWTARPNFQACNNPYSPFFSLSNVFYRLFSRHGLF